MRKHRFGGVPKPPSEAPREPTVVPFPVRDEDDAPPGPRRDEPPEVPLRRPPVDPPDDPPPAA